MNTRRIINLRIHFEERKTKMKKTNWLAITLVGIVALLILFWIGIMIGGWGYRGYGMMGDWGYSPFGWFGMGLGMLFMWLIPIGVITLIVFGVVSLVRNSGNPTSPTPQTPCPNCGKGTQADWQNCPYCGTALK
jgi:uncharacterized membrane protein